VATSARACARECVRTLLLSVEDVELSALGLDGRGLQIGHVAAGRRLRDGQTDDLLAAQARAAHQLLLVLAAEVQHWSAAGHSHEQLPCGNDETRSEPWPTLPRP